MMANRSPEADARTELILEVFRVNGDLLSEGDRIAGIHGQTSSRWQVLGALRNGAATVAGIARVMGRARQSVQRTADLLASEGTSRTSTTRRTGGRSSSLSSLRPVRRRWPESSALQVEWTNGLAAAIKAGRPEIEAATDVLRQLWTELERPAADPKGGRPQ